MQQGPSLIFYIYGYQLHFKWVDIYIYENNPGHVRRNQYNISKINIVCFYPCWVNEVLLNSISVADILQ